MAINKSNPVSTKTNKGPKKTVFDTAVLYERGNRPVMEDRYVLFQLGPQNLYGGVYDGHGGSLAAEYACMRLHEKFLESLVAGKGAEDAFFDAYKETDSEILDPLVGTTAVDFFLEGDILHYAHAGDSRLIIVKDSASLQLTFDHRVFDPEEAKRVKGLDTVIDDGYVVKGEFALQPTRTLGDQYFKKAGIIAEPTVGIYNLDSADKWLIAATDGLFDYLENGGVAEIVSRCATAQEACERLKQTVLTNTLHNDNVTAIVVKLME